MKLIELFDTNTYKWIDKQEDYHRAEFTVNKIDYSVICSVQDGWLDYKNNPIRLWDLSFTQTEHSLTATKTGSGNELIIFSNAIAAFREFLNSVKPELFCISCIAKEPNRLKLYMGLVNRFKKELTKLSYKIVDKQIKHEFTTVNNNSSLWNTIYFERTDIK